ncbi:hypothetical protein N781_02645 [Pontibacillus halophilus JSM 076056 = DSM 19796]|uniref:Nuclease SbcCD subunit C n=1 Tax=Pontibacillus halophilus JSM 076056 = DSM 19796 TaxID=1385510 RepID=A0A0A5GFQ3_9BACI|nr:SMC family ATPase [Pontibacillus halophilus]KGX92061.1 hypothetical protein N781_02645 [Pontibacillus halophilus JSM 076056 = DSM 19796]
MKALRLEVQAFGPYSDKQVIDFSELGEESIFLVTGPTGAGKTSVFDAIVYSLYGRASGSDRDQDTLRSHFADENLPTEVHFTFQLRDTVYEVYRSPKQFKKKDRGEGYTEQAPKAELYKRSIEGRELLSTKIKDVNDTIERYLHLDYEQFRKMIMIPQGEFRRLISENSKDREEILKKIFHTYVYEQMTEQLKEQSKELKQDIERLEMREDEEINKVRWDLTNEEKEEGEIPNFSTSEAALLRLDGQINNEGEKAKELEREAQTQREKLKEVQSRYYERKQLSIQFQQLRSEKEQLQQEHERKAEMDKLNEQVQLAQRAKLVIPYEEQWKNWDASYKKQQQRLEEYQQSLKLKQSTFQKTKEDYEREIGKEEEREEARQLIHSKKQELERLTQYESLLKEKDALAKTKEAKAETLASMESKEKERNDKIRHLISETSQSNEINKQYYEQEAKLKQLKETKQALSQLTEEEQTLTTLRNQYVSAKTSYTNKQQEVEAIQAEQERLEQAQRDQLAVRLAAHLHDGESCPVCGSTHHPSKAIEHGNVATDEAIEEKRILEQQKQQELSNMQEQFVNMKYKGQAQAKRVEEIETSLLEAITELGLKDKDRQEQLDHILERIKTYEQEFYLLNQRMERLQTSSNELNRLQRQEHEEAERKKDIEAQSQKAHDEWLSVEARLSQLQESLTDAKETTSNLSKWIEEQERQLSQSIEAFQLLEQRYQHQREDIQRIQTEVEQQSSYLNETKQQAEEARINYENKRVENGFREEEVYQASKVDEKQIQVWVEAVDEFKKRYDQLRESIRQLEVKLEGLEEPDLQKDEQLINEAEEVIHKLVQRQQEQQFQTETHRTIYHALQSYIKERVEKEQSYAYIGELAQLAKGDNYYKLSFERYVLAAFLDEIIIQANLRLDKMTDHRYQLERSTERAKGGAQSGLDMQVLDHYTGQKRSVKTLSGGEGFKAALSLALGMADVVQSHSGGVQLDTLFIDEGFGTLDEVSLEQAIDTLKDLQKGNRMLGIISHVPQLKQEIKAKLEINPSPSGSSARFYIST